MARTLVSAWPSVAVISAISIFYEINPLITLHVQVCTADLYFFGFTADFSMIAAMTIFI